MKNLKFKIFPAIILLFTFYILHSAPVFAQSASDSAGQLRNSVKQKVAEELAQIKQDITKKAFLGTISSKNDATFTLSNYLNQNRSAIVSTDTAIKLKNGSDGTRADLKNGDWILVMGDVDGAGIMTAKRLLVLSAPPADKRASVYGKVIATSPNLIVETPSKDKITARLASDTVITTSASGKTAKLKAADVKTGNTVVMITKSGTTSASVTDLYLFP